MMAEPAKNPSKNRHCFAVSGGFNGHREFANDGEFMTRSPILI